ncbi:MAG: hypothetical protein IIU77_03225 [Clostridia bacterium]|nr:hypothetical protein [Clostridia bacterium]
MIGLGLKFPNDENRELDLQKSIEFAERHLGAVLDKVVKHKQEEAVKEFTEKIIRKKSEIIEYWKNDVKQYRALKGYSDIEHDADNFLRGYNEAVEDMLAILDGARTDGDEDDL